jgi:hypothetical protein
MLDDADRIWNRACDPFAEHSTVGDQALQEVLRVHGRVMNGGLASALEYNAPDEIHRAVAGFQYLRLDDVALTLATAFDVAFPCRRNRGRRRTPRSPRRTRRRRPRALGTT